PTPNITQAKLILSEADWSRLPSGLFQTPLSWVFREDSFDGVTRTRRGRLYASAAGVGQPSTQRVVPHPYEDPSGRSVGQGGRQVRNLFTYTACTQLLNEPRQGLGETLALGAPR